MFQFHLRACVPLRLRLFAWLGWGHARTVLYTLKSVHLSLIIEDDGLSHVRGLGTHAVRVVPVEALQLGRLHVLTLETRSDERMALPVPHWRVNVPDEKTRASFARYCRWQASKAAGRAPEPTGALA